MWILQQCTLAETVPFKYMIVYIKVFKAFADKIMARCDFICCELLVVIITSNLTSQLPHGYVLLMLMSHKFNQL